VERFVNGLLSDGDAGSAGAARLPPPDVTRTSASGAGASALELNVAHHVWEDGTLEVVPYRFTQGGKVDDGVQLALLTAQQEGAWGALGGGGDNIDT
jgi:hypothetical protein